MKFNFGIEQEIALLRLKKRWIFVDFKNTKFEVLQKIVNKLPKYKEDYSNLRTGDLKIKEKRWYVEGFERFDVKGNFRECLVKGYEIRTNFYNSIDKTLDELKKDYIMLRKYLIQNKFSPVWISFNPFKSEFKPKLNRYEIKMRKQESPEATTANIANLTFGPDLNISFSDFNDEKLIDIGKKLTYYSPFIVPFSFSSPFKNGKLWKGYSYRTYVRTGKRPACMVFLNDEKNMIKSFPSLTQKARIEKEKGRIEFKAFDTCNSLNLYKALFILIKLIILDDYLRGKSLVPDDKMHKRSALYAFYSAKIQKECLKILKSIKEVANNQEKEYIYFLEEIAKSKQIPCLKLIKDYKNESSVIKSLLKNENLQV